MCQALNLRIVNGRFGSNKYFRGPTTYSSDASVIDYVIVCERMLPFISGFHIEMFDPCYSDVHSPVEFTLSVNDSAKSALSVCNSEQTNNINSIIKSEATCENENSKVSNTLPQMKFEWFNDIAVDFENVACDINVGDLFEKLDAISFNTTQKGIDNLCHHLNEKIISTAKAAGAYREIKKSKSRNSVQVKSPPWFDKEWMERRQQYYGSLRN